MAKRKISLPIRGDRRLSNTERLDIYANMYFFRIRDALKTDFPAVLKALGEIGFHNLITDYLIKHPSTHWSLRYAGRHLPRFLRSHPFTRKFPFLSDLARFEWALWDAFDAADVDILTEEVLRQSPPQKWGGLCLKTVPAAKVVRFGWPVDEIREALLKKKRRRPVCRETVALRIWRKGLEVRYARVDRPEASLLRETIRGREFGFLCERAARLCGPDDAVPRMTRLLRRWVADQLLSRPPAGAGAR